MKHLLGAIAYPYAEDQIGKKAISLTADTFKCALFTGDASAWTATQQAYQFLSDLKTAYTEVSSGGCARVTLTTMTYTYSGGQNTWTCTSPAPISFGSTITLAARSMCVFDSSIGGGTDSATPVIAVIDFGLTVTSTAGPWTYTVDPANGLAYWTEA